MRLAVLAVLLLSSSIIVGVPPASALTLRGPILISDNSQFTTANGVTGGSGTPGDPYVVEGWDIDAKAATGIRIENTDAHLLVRDLRVHSGVETDYYSGIELVNVANVRIENATLTTNLNGIYLNRVTNITIIGNDLSDNNQGLDVDFGTNLTISSNNVAARFQGMLIRNVDTLNLSDNDFAQVNDVAFWVSDSWDVTATGNRGGVAAGFSFQRVTGVLASGFVAAAADILVLDSRDVHVTSNEVRGIGIQDGANVSVTNNDGPGISLTNSNTFYVAGNNATEGLAIVYSANGTVASNTFGSASQGMRMYGSSNVTIIENSFAGYGLNLQGSNPVHFDSQSVVNNSVNGLPLQYYARCQDLVLDGVAAGQVVVASCRNVTVSNLSISGTHPAVEFAYVDDGRISANRLTNNPGEAITVWFGRNLTVNGNNISDNGRGFAPRFVSGLNVFDNVFAGSRGYLAEGGGTYLGFGLYLDAASDARIHHNRFLQNEEQAGGGWTNIQWDDGYPGGGNWWSDYRMHDECSGPSQDVCPDPDGFGDVPYRSSWGANDRYPQGPPNTPPVASFEVDPEAPVVNENVWFHAWGSLDPDGTVEEVRIDYGDGANGTSRFASTFVHTYTAGGTYAVSLTVLDNSGAKTSLSRDILVSSPADRPVASFTVSPWVPVAGSPAVLDASSSRDPRGKNLTYEWLFSGLNDPREGVRVTYVFPNPYTSMVYLRVTNEIGLWDEVRADVWVAEGPPALDVVEHAEGRFRLPVPRGWERSENVSVQGGVVELVVVRDSFFFPSNAIAVDTDSDPTLREDPDDLMAAANETIESLRDRYGFLEIHEPPMLTTVSGHAGVVFEVRHFDGIEAYAIVVSEEHGRYWIVGLSARENEYAPMRGLFDLMVDEFEILPAISPPPPPGDTPGGAAGISGGLLAAGLVGAAAGVAGLVVALLWRAGHPRSALPQMPACPDCGTRTSSGATYCQRCGGRLNPPA